MKKTIYMRRCFVFIIIFLCLFIGGRRLRNYIDYLSIAEDLTPFFIMELDNKELIMHFFQNNRENIRISLPDSLRPGGGRQYDLHSNKKEILLLEYADGIARYDFSTGEVRKVFSYSDVSNICDWHGITDIRFVPNSNNVSFITDYSIYLWEYEEQKYVKVYNFEHENSLKKLGFAYEWKNDKEIYMIRNQDLVLYNMETGITQVIVEAIGNIYFQMSEDEKYIAYQKQYGENREIMLMNLNSKEKQKVYIAKSGYRVMTDFSPNGKYIFIYDHHKDNHSGISYYYLYDIAENKKIEVNIDYPDWQAIGW